MFSNKNDLKTRNKDIDVQIWKQIIDVQMHFNEIKSKNQTMFVSILTALLAATGYMLMNKDIANNYFLLGSFKLYVYSIAIFVSIIFSFCFYILDHSYHILLKGSVDCGKDFETEHFNEELTSHKIEKLSKGSPLSLIFFDVNSVKGAGKKHKCFYGLIILTLILFFLLSLFSPIKSDKESSLSKQQILKKEVKMIKE